MADAPRKENIKMSVALNYFFMAICVGIAIYYYAPTPHHLNVSSDDVNELEEYFKKANNFTLFYKFESKGTDQDFINLLKEVYSDIRSTENLDKSAKENDPHKIVLLSITCVPGGTEKQMDIHSLVPLSLSYKGDCSDVTKSKPLKREFTRIIHSLTKDAASDITFKINAEIFNFNIVLMSSYKNPIPDNELENRISTLIISLLQRMNLGPSQFRINFKRIFTEDIDFMLPKDNINQTHIFNLTNYLIPTAKEVNYNFEIENINLYMILDSNLTITDEGMQYDYFDEQREKDALIVLRKDTNLELTIFRIIYRLFELDKLEFLPHKIKLDYDPKLIFDQFQIKKRNFLNEHIQRELKSFHYLINDTELIIQPTVGKEIDDFFAEIKRMISVKNLTIPEMHKIYQEIWSYNHLSTNDFAQRDAFPTDYKIGVYVPLLLPLLFPAFKAWRYAIKKLKKRYRSNRN